MGEFDLLISDLQGELAFKSLGKGGYGVFQGAIEDGATPEVALQIVTAYMAGLVIAATQQKEQETND